MTNVTPPPATFSANTPPEAPVKDEVKWLYVRLPDGSVQAVNPADVQEAPATSKQDGPGTPTEQAKPEAEFYVHLADGSVKRVKESDLPGGVGTNAPSGHWQEGNKVFQVIGVYPVEDIVKGA